MKNKNGYTIVELLVAIGIFVTVATIAVGGLARALHLQRQVASMFSVGSNLATVLEQITREARTGYLFCVDPNVGPPFTSALASCGCQPSNSNCKTVTQLTFINYLGQTVTYRLNNGAIERDNGSGFTPLTSPRALVTHLLFALQGQFESDNYPPRITILAGATTPQVPNIPLINLETTVSSRLLDN